ncbi:hypothetical protein ABK040_011508 [Willaertia magna]
MEVKKIVLKIEAYLLNSKKVTQEDLRVIGSAFVKMNKIIGQLEAENNTIDNYERLDEPLKSCLELLSAILQSRNYFSLYSLNTPFHPYIQQLADTIYQVVMKPCFHLKYHRRETLESLCLVTIQLLLAILSHYHSQVNISETSALVEKIYLLFMNSEVDKALVVKELLEPLFCNSLEPSNDEVKRRLQTFQVLIKQSKDSQIKLECLSDSMMVYISNDVLFHTATRNKFEMLTTVFFKTLDQQHFSHSLIRESVIEMKRKILWKIINTIATVDQNVTTTEEENKGDSPSSKKRKTVKDNSNSHVESIKSLLVRLFESFHDTCNKEIMDDGKY